MLSNSKQGGVTWNYTNCAMWMATKHGSPIILKNNGGDDWDDAPYEHNAGEPYNDWSELIEDNEDIFKRKYKHHEIKHKVLYFETESNMILPCDNYLNSPYSVEDINKKNKCFEVPIIIDPSNMLLDGYTSYLIAKQYNLKTVQAKVKIGE